MTLPTMGNLILDEDDLEPERVVAIPFLCALYLRAHLSGLDCASPDVRRSCSGRATLACELAA